MTTVEAADPSFMLTVRQGPSDQAPVIGTAGALLIAADPVVQRNGYIQITRPNAQTGWVASLVCETLAFPQSRQQRSLLPGDFRQWAGRLHHEVSRS